MGGGKDRCDATDPRCGADGKMRDEAPRGAAVPDIGGAEAEEVRHPLVVTDVMRIDLTVGREREGLVLNVGLYGEACPASVRQMLDFTPSDPRGGIDMISRKLLLEDSYYAFSVPVSFNRGGSLNVIYPEERLDFGVPSQTNAYGRSKGLAKPEGFTPQPRPDRSDVMIEPFPRRHDVAGLLSIPKDGIGYGGPGFETDDEAYRSAFQITAAPCPAMDREGRRVIGQLMDEESMATLARLASLPTKKGFKGVIPGQNAGPSLLKVSVDGVTTSSVAMQNVEK